MGCGKNICRVFEQQSHPIFYAATVVALRHGYNCAFVAADNFGDVLVDGGVDVSHLYIY